MKNYKELIIWQKGIEIVKTTYILIKKFPAEEKFGIVSQITRAAVSIPANIAEGSSRNSDKDYARFLQLFLGSAFEVQTYLVIAIEMNWARFEEIEKLELLLEEEIKMIHRFINTLNKAKS
ncbi:MAG TPA: four helix bundle protein [Chitinophagaceae bacterium]|nr:four helix bundle protein [Chitinophagaceae bacterium]